MTEPSAPRSRRLPAVTILAIASFSGLPFLLHGSIPVFLIDCLLLWGSAVFAMAAVASGRRVLALMLSVSYFIPASLLYAYAAGVGEYVNIDLLQFAYSNFVAMIVHLLQQAFWPAMLLLALWLFSCVLFAGAILGGRAPRINPRSGLLSIGAAMLLGFSLGSSHPIWALWPTYIRSDYTPDVFDWVVRTKENGATDGPRAVHPIIVIYIESLRYDVVSQEPSPIPHLRSMAEESGYLFARSYTSATSSHYSNPAFWFSQYPLRSRRLSQAEEDDPWPRKSLFDSLKAVGYETAYVSSQNENWGGMISWMKTPSVDYFFHSDDYQGPTYFDENDPWGLARLLKEKVITSGKIPDDETLRIASTWIAERDPNIPFAIGITLQNTHHSYYIPQGAPEPFQPSELDFGAVFGSWPERMKENVYNRYLNAVYNVDRALADFVDELKRRDLWEESLILVTGDGGEAFYEHGYANHGGPLYDEATLSFTWLKPPRSLGTDTPSVVEKPINHIDLVPSMFDLLGLPIPEEHQGVSFRRTDRPEVYLHADGFVKQNGIVEWPWKYLATLNAISANPQLFNLELDPSENNNVVEQFPLVVQAMETKLRTWRATQLAYHNTPQLYEQYFPPRYVHQEGVDQSEAPGRLDPEGPDGKLGAAR